MKVLGIDCTGESFSVAVVVEGKFVSEVSGAFPHKHLTYLMPGVEFALRGAGIKVGDLDGISVTVGPGSFTGVRLGVVTARSLAMVNDLPVVGLCSLEVQAAAHPYHRKVLVVEDARKKQLCAAVYDTSRGEPVEVSSPRLIGVDDFNLPADVVVTGGAPAKYPALFEEASIVAPVLIRPRGGVVAWLGSKRLRRGQYCRWTEIHPEYVRSAEVQVQG